MVEVLVSQVRLVSRVRLVRRVRLVSRALRGLVSRALRGLFIQVRLVSQHRSGERSEL